ncbi:MAG: pyridoxamine 5'-phosphate oxidase family protein, partial [Mesorhizobium sp.]
LGQIIRDQLALAEAAGDIDRELDQDYRQTMW